MSGRKASSINSDGGVCHIIRDRERCTNLHDSKALTRQYCKDVEEAGYQFVGPRPHFICKVHRTLVDNAIASYSVGQSAIGDNYELDFPQPDFSVLNTTSLSKYCKHYKLPEGASKQELLEIVQSHFAREPVSEHGDILSFSAKIRVEREEEAIKAMTGRQ
eukprot:m.24406 g.24406  ORF g.24406 m.24406 type:complete len:161 (+) comp5646_c0_seq1:120-602(+)